MSQQTRLTTSQRNFLMQANLPQGVARGGWDERTIRSMEKQGYVTPSYRPSLGRTENGVYTQVRVWLCTDLGRSLLEFRAKQAGSKPSLRAQLFDATTRVSRLEAANGLLDARLADYRRLRERSEVALRGHQLVDLFRVIEQMKALESAARTGVAVGQSAASPAQLEAAQ